MISKYEGGFCVHGKHQIETVEWLFNKESTNTKLMFQAYDANLYPLPDFSTWKNKEWNDKQIVVALKATNDFIGEVWLDDVKIK